MNLGPQHALAAQLMSQQRPWQGSAPGTGNLYGMDLSTTPPILAAGAACQGGEGRGDQQRAPAVEAVLFGDSSRRSSSLMDCTPAWPDEQQPQLLQFDAELLALPQPLRAAAVMPLDFQATYMEEWLQDQPGDDAVMQLA